MLAETKRTLSALASDSRVAPHASLESFIGLSGSMTLGEGFTLFSESLALHGHGAALPNMAIVLTSGARHIAGADGKILVTFPTNSPIFPSSRVNDYMHLIVSINVVLRYNTRLNHYHSF